MARNRKSKDEGGGLVVVLLLLLATLLVFLAMFYVAIAFIASFSFKRRLARLPVATSNRLFIPTREEARAIADTDQRLKQEKLDLQALNSQGRGLNKRNDGAFDERSSVGKDLNENLRACKREIADLQYSLQELRAYRSERYHHYVNAVVKARSWNQATIVYVLAFLGFMVVTPDWVTGLTAFLTRNSWIGPIASMPLLWGVMTAAALVSVALLGLNLLIRPYFFRKSLNNAPAPEESVAIAFTERYATLTGIGTCDPSDSNNSSAEVPATAHVQIEAELLVPNKELQASSENTILANSKQVDAPNTMQTVASTVAISTVELQSPQPATNEVTAPQLSEAKPVPTKSQSKPVKKWVVPALWKRLSFALLGGALGTLIMIIVIGGMKLPVWIAAPVGLGAPFVGLVMGFKYYKYFNKPIKELT